PNTAANSAAAAATAHCRSPRSMRGRPARTKPGTRHATRCRRFGAASKPRSTRRRSLLYDAAASLLRAHTPIASVAATRRGPPVIRRSCWRRRLLLRGPLVVRLALVLALIAIAPFPIHAQHRLPNATVIDPYLDDVQAQANIPGGMFAMV